MGSILNLRLFIRIALCLLCAYIEESVGQVLPGTVGRCSRRAMYLYGNCRYPTCFSQETYVPGSSHCDIQTQLYGLQMVRCSRNLPCCVWGGTCRSNNCEANEISFNSQSECPTVQSRPGICCVSTAVGLPSTGSVATRQGECGVNATIQPRIVGGTIARSTDWPWMVQIVYPGNVQARCAGVLVDDDTVITVAHCLDGVPINQIQVLVGEFDNSRVDVGEELIGVKGVNIDSGFVNGNIGNDFAVVKLARSVRFSRTRRPACLPDPAIPLRTVSSNSSSARCFVAGWGVANNGQVSNQLRTAPVSLMDRDTCNAILSSVSGNFNELPEDVLCTDTSATTSDACQYDDGGMLSCLDVRGRYSLMGLVSQYSCGSLPTVYTKVSNYVESILAQL